MHHTGSSTRSSSPLISPPFRYPQQQIQTDTAIARFLAAFGMSAIKTLNGQVGAARGARGRCQSFFFSLPPLTPAMLFGQPHKAVLASTFQRGRLDGAPLSRRASLSSSLNLSASFSGGIAATPTNSKTLKRRMSGSTLPLVRSSSGGLDSPLSPPPRAVGPGPSQLSPGRGGCRLPRRASDGRLLPDEPPVARPMLEQSLPFADSDIGKVCEVLLHDKHMLLPYFYPPPPGRWIPR